MDPEQNNTGANGLGAGLSGPPGLAMAGGNATSPQPAAPAPPLSPEAAHSTLRARFDKLEEAEGRLAAVRGEMDHLVSLGDVVQTEDVVKAASRLVGHGLDPRSLASMLADMPTSNAEQLAAWVLSQDAQVRGREAQLASVAGATRHALGIAAMRVLMQHAAEQANPQLGASPVNALTPSAAPEGASSPSQME